MLVPSEEVSASVEHEKIGDDQADEAFLDDESADDSSVVIGQTDSEQLPLPPVQFLPPVELVIENEIWQYRYPPFETLFTSENGGVNEGNNALGGGSNTFKSHSDTLPSYVLGILDPAELVSGIFNFRTPLGPSTWQPIDGSISRNTNSFLLNHQQQFGPIFDEGEAFQNHDETFRRDKGRPFAETEEKVTKSGQQRSIVVSDDHWIWKRS